MQMRFQKSFVRSLEVSSKKLHLYESNIQYVVHECDVMNVTVLIWQVSLLGIDLVFKTMVDSRGKTFYRMMSEVENARHVLTIA